MAPSPGSGSVSADAMGGLYLAGTLVALVGLCFGGEIGNERKPAHQGVSNTKDIKKQCLAHPRSVLGPARARACSRSRGSSHGSCVQAARSQAAVRGAPPGMGPTIGKRVMHTVEEVAKRNTQMKSWEEAS